MADQYTTGGRRLIADPNQPGVMMADPSQTDYNPNTAISVDQLNPVAPLNVPTPPPVVNPTESTVAGATATSKSLDQYIQELTPPETETSKAVDTLTQDISGLLPGLQGRGQAQLDAETAAGLPALKKGLADLNAQILSKVAEATKANAEYEKLTQTL